MRVVLCTAPLSAAEPIARALVEARAAACVNLVPGVTSIYRWQGAISRDDEILLIIKTRDEALASVHEVIRRTHPYEVPEIVALAPNAGDVNADYAKWVEAETDAK